MDSKYCFSCGSQIKKEAEICPECGVRQKSAKKEKSTGLAVLLSLIIPGLGQIYNGEILKGIGVFLSEIVIIGLMMLLFIVLFATSDQFILLLFFLLGIVVITIWLYSMYDAHHVARQINLN